MPNLICAACEQVITDNNYETLPYDPQKTNELPYRVKHKDGDPRCRKS